MKKALTIASLLVFALITGCSFNHPVAKDYDKHLAEAKPELSSTAFETDYSLTDNTMNHRYEFRALSVGYAHLWIVEFGKILEKALQSEPVQASFGRLEKSEGADAEGTLVQFDLESFEFKNFRAYTSLNIDVLKDGTSVFNKTYTSEGGSEGAQMVFAGAFGMTNSTLTSTKDSIDKILNQFIEDVNERNLAGN